MALDSQSCRLAFGQLCWLLEALWVVMLHLGGIMDSLCSIPTGQKNHGKFIIFILKSGWCLRLRLAHVWGTLECSLLWCLNVDITLKTSFSVFQTIVIPLHTAQTLHRAWDSVGLGVTSKKRVTKQVKVVKREISTFIQAHTSPPLLECLSQRENDAVHLIVQLLQAYHSCLVCSSCLPSNLPAKPLGSTFQISRILPFVFLLLSPLHTDTNSLSLLTRTIKIISFVSRTPLPSPSLCSV